jgi:plasmid stability protein
MATLTVRNLPEEVHRALRVRAAAHGRSTEAEVREIIAATVAPSGRLRMGEALAALGREIGLEDDDLSALDELRDRDPATPVELP